MVADGPPEHVNAERDVLYVLLEGAATLTIDGEPRELQAGEALIVARGTWHGHVAGLEGVRYFTAHRRRGGLQIKPLR